MRAAGVRDWDANWLMIAGRVDCDKGSWTFRDPCLTTFELAQLLAWLASLPHPTEPILSFTEPLLAFVWDPPRERSLAVRLRGEALPAQRDRWSTVVELSFAPDPQSLGAFVDELRRQVERFPEK
jgi:hypothetical protein